MNCINSKIRLGGFFFLELAAGFYKQRYRYLPEFEQAYRIFEEEGAGDNPVQIADTMASLEMHKEASKHDLEELHQYFEGPMEGKKGNHPYTNQQFLDRSFHWIVNTITYEYNFLPGETLTSRADSQTLSGRNSSRRVHWSNLFVWHDGSRGWQACAGSIYTG